MGASRALNNGHVSAAASRSCAGGLLEDRILEWDLWGISTGSPTVFARRTATSTCPASGVTQSAAEAHLVCLDESKRPPKAQLRTDRGDRTARRSHRSLREQIGGAAGL
jgi:hypothetical protein